MIIRSLPTPQLRGCSNLPRPRFGPFGECGQLCALEVGTLYNPRVLQEAQAGRLLSPDQFLLTTLIVKLAVMAVLATMVARYRRFRHILIFERRGWLDRLVFMLAIGLPLAAGVVFRLLLHYNAADLTLEGAFLAGLIAGPYTGALVGLLVAIPALIAGEFIALPFAVGCGFAGGGLREAAPKEAIWQFTPFVFIDLHKHVWR